MLTYFSAQRKISLQQHVSPPKSAIEMPTRGIEPRTSGLQDLRSTTELYGLVLIGHALHVKFERMANVVCRPMSQAGRLDKVL